MNSNNKQADPVKDILGKVRDMRNIYNIGENGSKASNLDSMESQGDRRNDSLNTIYQRSADNLESGDSNSSSYGGRVSTKQREGVIKQTRVQTYSSIQVSNTQKGNPLLSSSLLKNIPWSYNSSILSDYYINPKIQFLFLSMKYHKLHPEYIWQRLKKLNKGSSIENPVSDGVLRILLVVVDVDSHQEILRRLSNLCIRHDLSLVLAWSFEEAGNYIAFSKSHEDSASKVDSVIRGTRSNTYQSNVVDCLTTIRAINKTDSIKLLANCGSIKQIVLDSCKQQDSDDPIAEIQGIGQRKYTNMRNIFSKPFILNKNYDSK